MVESKAKAQRKRPGIREIKSEDRCVIVSDRLGPVLYWLYQE
jgi:hypothetical protein